MSFKTMILCASAYLVQSIAGQCVRPIISTPSCGCASISVPSSGGPLIATSVGPIRPSGISVATDLSLGGDLVATGALPFLTAVAFEGAFPISGSAAVSYGCGDGLIAVTQKTGNPGGSNVASPSGLGLSAVGLGSCGCRLY